MDDYDVTVDKNARLLLHLSYDNFLLKPLVDVGFIAQPVGGVPDYTYVDWGPIFYLAGGLCF